MQNNGLFGHFNNLSNFIPLDELQKSYDSYIGNYIGKNDHYKTLELDDNATQDDIRKSYMKLIKKCHPDKNNNQNNKQVSNKFQEICIAYNILSNIEKKKEYDYKKSRTINNFMI